MPGSTACLGHGEVGAAIASLAQDAGYDTRRRDPAQELNDSFEGCGILHVCIPAQVPQFAEIVAASTAECVSRGGRVVVIVHASVTPGTTKQVAATFARLHPALASQTGFCHSPIRGMHPDLKPHIKNFVKYVGADDQETERLAVQHLRSLGMPVETMQGTAATELAKVMSTSYYGVVLTWADDMRRMCEAEGVSYQDAVVRWNRTYNDGYAPIRPNVIRPVFEKIGLPLGGHCVLPNAALLLSQASRHPQGVWPKQGMEWVLRSSGKLPQENKDSC